MELIETAPHEFNANYQFTGLEPFFALDSVIKQYNGARKSTIQTEQEDRKWRVSLYFQDSNIVNPGEELPTGTRFDLDTIREFRLSVELSGDNHAGQKSFNMHVRPRWKDMKVEDKYGNETTLNHPLNEGINTRLQGSNIEFSRYLELARKAFESVGVSRRYLSEPHESSVVTQAERYVRISKDKSGPIHARSGPLAKLGHTLENDRDGRREIEQADTAEDGEQVPGYRHQVGLDEQRVNEVLPSHELPKRWKHYRSRNGHSMDNDNPLAHPKLGCIYYGSLWRDKSRNFGVSTEEIEQLNRELDEAVLAVLQDAGLPISSTAPYVGDDYFSCVVSDRDRTVPDLPLEQIKQDQENIVIRNIADGLSPIAWDSLQTLVSDGGQVSPKDIAEDGGWHQDSVYRALDDIEDMVDRQYGSVSLASTHVADLVHSAVKKAKQGAKEAVEAASKALEGARRGVDQRTSALAAWASKYLESFDSTGNEPVEISAGKVKSRDRLREILRDGKSLWKSAGKDMFRYRQGQLTYKIETNKYRNNEVKLIKEPVRSLI